MAMQHRLQSNKDALLDQYRANLEATRELQDTLLQDILPSIADELELDGEAVNWAEKWLLDTPSIFRISRRNKFTRSFALEAIRKNLLWRFSNLWPLAPSVTIPNLRCLPPDVRDPFGRPILVIETAPVDADADEQKRLIIQAFERLRAHLQNLFDQSEIPDDPPLQFVVLMDLQQLSFQSLNIDLFTWTVREVIPRFPGMIAGVFMTNYSWTHSGIWGIFKRLLPESALSRIFFPDTTELVNYFTPSALPKRFGGALPTEQLRCPLHPEMPPLVERTAHTTARIDSPPGLRAQTAVTTSSDPTSAPALSPASSWLSSTSLLNPFFGYPVTTLPNQLHSFPHGRRRKRDLARTLALLFWARWRPQIIGGAIVCILVVVCRHSLRKGWLVRFPRAHSLFWKLNPSAATTTAAK